MLALSLGAPWLLWPAVVLLALACVVVALAYRGLLNRGRLSMLAAGMKCFAFGLLALCLLEPYLNRQRPRPGANVFVVLADNSQSLNVLNAEGKSRSDGLRQLLTGDQSWKTRLDQDFDTRNYQFDLQLAAAGDFEGLDFRGQRTELARAIRTVAERYRNQPVAGVLLFTDGNSTGTAESEQLADLEFPVYPVLPTEESLPRDMSIRHVAVRERNFEAAPVTITAEVGGSGFEETPVIVELLDREQQVLESKRLSGLDAEAAATVRFQLPSVHFDCEFYSIRLREDDAEDEPSTASETTLANNSRQVVVNPGGGPYRVLYVGGRPNWEFKYLRRSVAADPEMELVGLLRIARKEPKFNFIGHRGESTNPLFRGFGNEEDETAEQYDEPVLIRLSTKGEEELKEGFPRTAPELFAYSAVILDDVESQFFSQEQLSLMREFVSRRGGSLLMLGGAESYAGGRYDKTPLAELLPVYLEQLQPSQAGPQSVKLNLTAEGWIEPWLRVRQTEAEERNRLASMPSFETLNGVAGVKPGATVLAEAVVDGDVRVPALVSQRFGRGRSSALLLGDLWRWGLERAEGDPEDLQRAWRQLTRWMVSDIPERVDVRMGPGNEGHPDSIEVSVKVLDESFLPQDNAIVQVTFRDPEDNELTLDAEATAEPGVFRVAYRPRQSGSYTALVAVRSADGEAIADRRLGWVSQPEADEFRELAINRSRMEQLAAATGGECIAADELAEFVTTLPTRRVPVTEPWAFSLWHHGVTYTLILLALVLEWGIRRLNGLA